MSQFGNPPGRSGGLQPPSYSRASSQPSKQVAEPKPVSALQWNVQAQPIKGSWRIPTDPLVSLEAVWQTPILDLRPELGAVTGRSAEGQKIWSYTGGWGPWPELFVQVDLDADPNVPTNDLQGLRVLAFEDTSAVQGGELEIQLSGTDYDVSSFFHQGGIRAAMLRFRAPGGPTPIRYWRLGLRFQYDVAPPDTPAFTISAGWY